MEGTLAKTVQSLESRRAALAGELAKIDARLTAIRHAVHTSEDKSAAPATRKTSRATARRQSKRTRRSWFERDEAVSLIRRAAKSPISQADLMRQVARLKGYAGKLSKDDEKRMQGAVYIAIAQALRAKALRRTAGGQVVAA
jgi:hypothetical protein